MYPLYRKTPKVSDTHPSLLGGAGGLLASTSLSNRYLKAELRELENVRKMVLPVNAVTQDVNQIKFGEQDKAGFFYPIVDPLVIKVNIIGTMVCHLLVDGGAFCNILFKKSLDQLGDFEDYVEPCEHVVRGFGDGI